MKSLFAFVSVVVLSNVSAFAGELPAPSYEESRYSCSLQTSELEAVIGDFEMVVGADHFQLNSRGQSYTVAYNKRSKIQGLGAAGTEYQLKASEERNEIGFIVQKTNGKITAKVPYHCSAN